MKPIDEQIEERVKEIEIILMRFAHKLETNESKIFKEVAKNTALQELSNLIQKEREEAVRGFAKYMRYKIQKYKERNGISLTKTELNNLTTKGKAEYLSQTKGGEDE
jgi:CRISPR/Cas system CMR-associated protein Cmr3 (group 5 of RAMP superfamily)